MKRKFKTLYVSPEGVYVIYRRGYDRFIPRFPADRMLDEQILLEKVAVAATQAEKVELDTYEIRV